jgi:hypothetical protein
MEHVLNANQWFKVELCSRAKTRFIISNVQNYTWNQGFQKPHAPMEHMHQMNGNESSSTIPQQQNSGLQALCTQKVK